jgi:hypothetical protein
MDSVDNWPDSELRFLGSMPLTAVHSDEDNFPTWIASHGRHFIGALSVAVPALSSTRLHARSTAFRALSFDHLHTGERLTIEYFSEGQYLTEALLPSIICCATFAQPRSMRSTWACSTYFTV